MKDKIIDLRDRLSQLNVSNQIRVKIRHAFPPSTEIDQFERATVIIDEDITNLIEQITKLCEEIYHEI